MDNANIVLVIVLFVIGLVAIIKGGDWFVDAASWMAEATGIPKLIVGATVVSIGTTLPELLVSVIATTGGEYDMAAGNAIGSVTANVAVIMSLALIFMPSVIKRRDYICKSILMFLPTALIFAFSFNGNAKSELPLVCSILLLVIFGVNIGENVFGAVRSIRLEKGNCENADEQSATQEKIKPTTKQWFIKLGIFIFGAFVIFVGAQLLQTSAITIATKIHISKQIISLTIVAIGTSLPELVTTITAIRKKENSLSAGNIIGANIIDMTLILAICGIISGGALEVSAQTILLDIPMALLVGAVALVPALITGKFKRWQGFVNMGIYVGYVIFMVIAQNNGIFAI